MKTTRRRTLPLPLLFTLSLLLFAAGMGVGWSGHSTFPNPRWRRLPFPRFSLPPRRWTSPPPPRTAGT